MGATYQADNIQAPYDPITANDFRVRKFTATTTHRADAVPEGWAGKYVSLYADGDTVHYAFSKASDAEVDSAATATDAGESDKIGFVLPNGTKEAMRIPYVRPGETLYFVREAASGSADVYMQLASG